MSLGTRLTLKTAVLVLAVVVVAGAALWGLGGLNRDLDDALGEYDRLRKAYVLISDVEQARSAAFSTTPIPDRIRQPTQRAVLMLDEQSGVFDDQTTAAMRRELMEVLGSVEGLSIGEAVSPTTTQSLYTVINKLVSEISDTEERIKAIEQNADRHRSKVLTIIASTATMTAILAIMVGVWQYLAVMNPLKRLQRGVERLASGDFADPLQQTGDREFVALANDFNRMADELQALYNDLESKVRLRSAQLAQSERLASVGFLAAGVAHEINNPLAIIAGEAELALGALPQDADAELRRSLTTTRDEAFRCKGITQKLLSLARPGSGAAEPITLYQLAEEVASLVKSLPQHEGRELIVEGDRALSAASDPSQIKQVLLNLVINALEAVPQHTGQVRVACSQNGDRAALSVIDNGKGIDAEALPRVFEPFYTEKKSPTTPGLGLGLSISHAIIEDLGGRLTADSPGVDQGSTFTIELPLTNGGITT